MRASIVTISFNQAHFLERAICSVLSQPGEVEYIVVDPGSTDGSRDIIERYRSRISKVIFEPDKGPADGLNKGFAHASGEIYGFLNSDDVLLPDALSRAVSFLAEHPEVDVVSGHAVVIDGEDRRIRISHSDRFSLVACAYGAAVLMQASTFFRPEPFKRCRGFNVNNRSNWDGELFIDMALKGARFALVDEIWSGYRVHAESITGSGKMDAAFQAYRRRMFEKIMLRRNSSTDAYVAAAFRILKHIRNPRGLRERVLHGPVYGACKGE